jgi:hypothetical protein
MGAYTMQMSTIQNPMKEVMKQVDIRGLLNELRKTLLRLLNADECYFMFLDKDIVKLFDKEHGKTIRK